MKVWIVGILFLGIMGGRCYYLFPEENDEECPESEYIRTDSFEFWFIIIFGFLFPIIGLPLEIFIITFCCLAGCCNCYKRRINKIPDFPKLPSNPESSTPEEEKKEDVQLIVENSHSQNQKHNPPKNKKSKKNKKDDQSILSEDTLKKEISQKS